MSQFIATLSAVNAALSLDLSALSEEKQVRIGKIVQRISDDAALIAKVAAQKGEAAASLQDQVQVGRRVAFIFGRADTAVELQGTVFARKEAVPGQKGSFPQVKIEVGEGFDTELKTVHPNSVIRFLDEISPETVAEIDADIGSYGA
jgi:hypothetical protein